MLHLIARSSIDDRSFYWNQIGMCLLVTMSNNEVQGYVTETNETK